MRDDETVISRFSTGLGATRLRTEKGAMALRVEIL
jgi:hypothetical protein